MQLAILAGTGLAIYLGVFYSVPLLARRGVSLLIAFFLFLWAPFNPPRDFFGGALKGNWALLLTFVPLHLLAMFSEEMMWRGCCWGGSRGLTKLSN